MKASEETVPRHRLLVDPEQEVFADDKPLVTTATTQRYKPHIMWLDAAAILFVHATALYGLYLMFIAAKWQTTVWVFVVVYTSGFGITAGVHRLWSHRAYKAKWPLRLILIFLFTICGQKHVHGWALDHRVHHRYSETDADPHDARRGFWFSHVGWLVLSPHPDVVARRHAVDMSDLDNDPITYWQKVFYVPLFALLCIALPTAIPVRFWGEDLIVSFFVSFCFRFAFTLNLAFSVNSFAHMYGARPYNKSISPVENLVVSMGALGEGWHNYHHVFPYDYKTSELGRYFNWTTAFIDTFARIGWAYDCKTVSDEMVRRRAAHSGDGTASKLGHE